MTSEEIMIKIIEIGKKGQSVLNEIKYFDNVLPHPTMLYYFEIMNDVKSTKKLSNEPSIFTSF